MSPKTVAVAIIAAALLSGCAWQRTMDTKDRLAKEQDAIENELALDRVVKPKTVVPLTKPWVSKVPLPVPVEEKMPAALKCRVSFNPEQPVSVYEFAQMMTSWCGVPVRVTQDAMVKLSGGSNGGMFIPPIRAMTSGQMPPLPGAQGGPVVPAIMPGGNSTTNAFLTTRGMISGIKWKDKPIAGLLPIVASSLGISWKYEKGTIYLFYTETKIYELAVAKRTLDMRSTIQSGTEVMAQSSGGSGGSSGSTGGSSSGGNGGTNVSGGSRQTTDVSIKTDLAKDIETTLKALLTPGLGVEAMATGAGMVTVTDTPEAQDRIGQFIKQMNYAVTRQVKLNIDIYNLELTDADQYGLDLNLVYKRLGKFAAGLATGQATNAQALTGTLGTVDGPWAGSSAMIQALSTFGHIKAKQSFTQMVMNLSAMPIQIADTKGFVASQSTTQTANVGSQTSLVAGSVTTGFNMTVLPRIINNDEMVLYLSASIAPEAKIRPITGDGIRLEVPDTKSKSVQQEVKMRSGQTMIMSGYEVEKESVNQQGTGSPGFFGLGGGFDRSKDREVLVVVITPIIED